MSDNKINDTRIGVDLTKQVKSFSNKLDNNTLIFKGEMTIKEISGIINKPIKQIIKKTHLENATESTKLNVEQIGELALEFGLDFKKEQEINEKEIFNKMNVEEDETNLVTRPPVVTIMGHVDHGKTTLLDYIRKTRVQAKEAGGITQHIGAYQIKYNNFPITFLDTPGHEAFSAMRKKGASLTDIIILVVAADDGIKAQTKEAIKHAKASNLPIIVFVNKMDKPNVNPENVMNQLADNGLMPEEWGGETIVVKGSAMTGMNVDKLLEVIILQAEIHEYKANPNRLAIGSVVESSIEKGLGSTNTVIVQNGSLYKGDFVIAGSAFGKIKIMFDENNNEVKIAGPSTPVKLIGLNKSVASGQKFIVSKDERLMKEFASKVNDIENDENAIVPVDLEPSIKKFNLIIKTDVYGSLEAIKDLVNQINIAGIKPIIVKSGVGGINENDVMIGKSSKSIIIGFNVKPMKNISDSAAQAEIKILFYDIIYKLQDDIIKMMEGTLDPIVKEEETGEAIIQQIWQHSKVGTIAGCKCTTGTIYRNDSARVLRDGVVLYKTKIGSMKHFKDEASKIANGQEFGITLEKINDLKVGDVIQCYKIVKEIK